MVLLNANCLCCTFVRRKQYIHVSWYLLNLIYLELRSKLILYNFTLYKILLNIRNLQYYDFRGFYNRPINTTKHIDTHER